MAVIVVGDFEDPGVGGRFGGGRFEEEGGVVL
jgi:hypothetical protein